MNDWTTELYVLVLTITVTGAAVIHTVRSQGLRTRDLMIRLTIKILNIMGLTLTEAVAELQAIDTLSSDLSASLSSIAQSQNGAAISLAEADEEIVAELSRLYDILAAGDLGQEATDLIASIKSKAQGSKAVAEALQASAAQVQAAADSLANLAPDVPDAPAEPV
jgi:hypothetical protein